VPPPGRRAVAAAEAAGFGETGKKGQERVLCTRRKLSVYDAYYPSLPFSCLSVFWWLQGSCACFRVGRCSCSMAPD
jgi:hypothetical protein